MRPLLALFIRTLREHGRARSTYLLRGMIAAMMLLFLFLAHDQLGWSGAPGQWFFSMAVGLNYVFVTLAGLGVCSAVIAEEKEEGTLGLLRMTDLNALAILLGKGAGRFTTLLLVLAVQIPFALLAVTLGGVSARQVFTAYLLLAGYLTALAGLGLFFSTLLAKVWRAVAMMVCLGIAVSLLISTMERWAEKLNPYGLRWNPADGAVEWAHGKLSAGVGAAPNDAATVRRVKLADALNDASELAWSVHPAHHVYYLVQTSYLSLQVGRSLIVHGTLGLAGFLLAWLVFERRCGDEAAYGESRVANRWQRRLQLLRPARTWPSAVAWKDFHFHFGGWPLFALRLLLYPAFIAIYIWDDWPRPARQEIESAAWFVGMLAFYLEATLLTLRSWAPEVWGRNLPSLITTPRALRRMHVQKLAAAALAILPSTMVLALAAALDDWSVFRDLFTPQYVSSQTFVNGVQQTTQMAMPPKLLNYASMAAYSLGFLAYCLNFSLRLRWTALPAAIGAWLMTQLLATILVGIYWSTRIMMAINNSKFSYQIVEITQAALFTLLTLALLYESHRQLLRRAAQ